MVCMCVLVCRKQQYESIALQPSPNPPLGPGMTEELVKRLTADFNRAYFVTGVLQVYWLYSFQSRSGLVCRHNPAVRWLHLQQCWLPVQVLLMTVYMKQTARLWTPQSSSQVCVGLEGAAGAFPMQLHSAAYITPHCPSTSAPAAVH